MLNVAWHDEAIDTLIEVVNSITMMSITLMVRSTAALLTVGDLRVGLEHYGWYSSVFGDVRIGDPDPLVIHRLRDEDPLRNGDHHSNVVLICAWRSDIPGAAALPALIDTTPYKDIDALYPNIYAPTLRVSDGQWVTRVRVRDYGSIYATAYNEAIWQYDLMSALVPEDDNPSFTQAFESMMAAQGSCLITNQYDTYFLVVDETGTQQRYHALDLEGKRRGAVPEPRSNDPTDYLAEARAYFAAHIADNECQPKGCTDAEVNDFENKIGFRLPLAYRQYLLWMGLKACGAWWGRNLTELRFVLSHTIIFRELYFDEISSATEYTLPEHSIAFVGNGEHNIYAWFNLPKTAENPPVYELDMGEIKTYATFTDYLFKWLRADAVAAKRRRVID